MPARSNLNSLFADFAHYAHDAAVVQHRGYRRETWTYAKLASMAYVCACQLRERGAGTGDRILLWGPNSAEWMAAFWGCLLIGAVAVPLDQGSTPEFAARVARETSARVTVASREAAHLISTADFPPVDPLGTPIPSMILDDLLQIAESQGNIVVRQQSDSRPWHESFADEPITRNHIAQILFTSGTTAEPRGVVLTHGNFLANLEPLERGIDPYRKYERWTHPLHFATLVPLSHVFGQFMAIFVPPLLGATIIFEPSANPSEIMRTIKRERATALIAVPRMLDGLHNGLLRDLESRGEKKWFDNTFAAADGKKFLRRAWLFRRIHRRFGWKFWAFISGGAALSPETESFFKGIGYAVVQGYGMTETASLISLNHPFRAAQGTIGKVLPGREFKLAEDGEILVRGDNVATGYWQAGALRPSDEHGSSTEAGWLRTGDIGELDPNGNLRFRGRKKNVIVTPAGLNVYPEDLEAALRQQAGVRNCVVVPIERGGNAEPCAALLMNAAGELAAQRAVETANRSLAEFQRMRIWVTWPDADFPRTPTGKPRLAEISAGVDRILHGTNPASSSATVSKSLEQLVSRFARSTATPAPLEEQLNLSSLDRVELISALEERYQVELSETAFAEAKTVADVERLLRASSSGSAALRGLEQRNTSEPTKELADTGGRVSSAPYMPERAARQPEYAYPRWTQREPVRWLRLAVYYALVWPATQILGHPKIVGRENLRGVHGPVLVVSNHITRRADMGLILAALPLRFRHRLATAMGGETLRRMRRPPPEWLFAKRWSYQIGYWLVTALFNVFPLPQFSGFRESFRFAGESVDRGYSVLVFPEGETNQSPTGEMAKFQSGIGLLAENLRVPIVPMRLDGVWKMKRERRRLARLGEITVRIGKPATFSPGTPPGEIATWLESLVRTM
jgi:long-chain acyl-CoA synthetase